MTNMDVEVTFVTGPRKSGKTLTAYALYQEFCPRFDTVWIDEGGRNDMGAISAESFENQLTGKKPGRIVVSSGDSALLGVVLERLQQPVYIRTVRCEAPVVG